MSRVQAWERLNNPEYCGQLRMEQFYSLLLEAGYTEEVAQKVAQQRGWDRLEAEVAM